MNNQPVPHDRETEMNIVGAMCLHPPVIDEMADILHNGQPFYDRDCQRMYHTLAALHMMGEPIDLTVLCSSLNTENVPCGAGRTWEQLAIECVQGVSYHGNAPSWAKIVVKHYLRRLILTASESLRTISGDPQGDPLANYDDWASGTDGKLKRWEGNENNLDVCHSIEQNEDEETALPMQTGVHELDDAFGGFSRGALTVIAARTSVGKTSLALTCHYRMTKHQGHKSLFVSIEQGAREIGARMLAQDAGIVATDTLHGQTQPAIIRDIRETIAGQPWSENCRFIYDRQRCEHICAAIRTSVRKHGTEIAFVDYLQMMDCDVERGENRERQVSKMTKMLKGVAKRCNIAVVLVAQLNRCPDKRTDRSPKLSDLRESGAIEQEADVVLFLYQEDDSLAGVQFRIAKNRNGQKTGWLDISFDKPLMIFGSLTNAQGTLDYRDSENMTENGGW